ncbi:MAG: hypothetical protein ACR2I0_14335, partial [Rhodoferax sp.]
MLIQATQPGTATSQAATAPDAGAARLANRGSAEASAFARSLQQVRQGASAPAGTPATALPTQQTVAKGDTLIAMVRAQANA